MIITLPGKYSITPLTAQNSYGAYYQVRILEVTEADPVNQRIFCPDFGWMGWEVHIPKEGKKQ